MPTKQPEMREARVSAGDMDLHVTETGAGPPLVWLHGSGPASTGVGTFAGNLGRFAGFRNLLIDLPRFGGSDRPEVSGPLFPHAAERLGRVLDELDVRQATFVAQSYGAAVALKLAADRPELVGKCVGLAAAGAFPPSWEPAPALAHGAAYMQAPSPPREEMAALFRAAVYDKALITEQLLDERMEIAQRTHPELPTPPEYGDLHADLPRVSAPTLLLWGREDECLGLDVAVHMAGLIPDCELRVLPFCGHWIHVDRPALFERTVLDFIEADR